MATAFHSLSCAECLDGVGLDFAISMAFQPIVDVAQRVVYGYEALVRGVDGAGAPAVLARVTPANRYGFDQACRVKAIEWAARLALPGRLSINFLPNAVYRPETCIRATLEASARFGFPTERLIFEANESEHLTDFAHLVGIFEAYRRQGFLTALDDFGAGYAGLTRLAEFQPDLLKLDIGLIRGIDTDHVRAALVRGIMAFSQELGLSVVAEGVETVGELAALRAAGVTLFQGYLLARPAFETLPPINWDAVAPAA